MTFGCDNGHRFDRAREGYVNLLIAGQRRSREPGDSKEMVAARRRFLATGPYQRLTTTLAWVVARAAVAAREHGATVPVLLDVGCGDGHHTRAVASAADGIVCGIDVAKPAVAAAAKAHGGAWYAVASAADLPLAPASVDVVLNVFGPIVPAELARVLHAGGTAVVAHPGPRHLAELRRLVYAQPQLHEVKDPLRGATALFTRTGRISVTFPFVTTDPRALHDLFTMTPYRWHAPPDVDERLDAAARDGFVTDVDVIITTYTRQFAP